MGLKGIFAPLKGLIAKESEKYTISAVGAGATVSATISFGDGFILLGIPKVWTDTADASVKLVNGGLNEFTVEVTNSGAAVQDVVVKYDALLYRGA